MSIYRRYSERTPLKEEADPGVRRRRLLKIGATAALFALGVIDGSIPDLIANAIDFVKDMNVADLNQFSPDGSVVDAPLVDPSDGVMS